MGEQKSVVEDEEVRQMHFFDIIAIALGIAMVAGFLAILFSVKSPQG